MAPETAKSVRMTTRRLPPPWSIDDPDVKLGQACFIVRDANGHALAYVYFNDEPAHLLTRDEARRNCGEHYEAAGAFTGERKLATIGACQGRDCE
jgi:hypothetical protein